MILVVMKDDIRQIKQLTIHAYGVNLFIPEFPSVTKSELKNAELLLDPYRKNLQLEDEPGIKDRENVFDKQIELILQERVPECSFTFGVHSKDVIKDLRDAGIVVIGTATTVKIGRAHV